MVYQKFTEGNEMKCSKCQAVMNPKWQKCMACGSPACDFDAELDAAVQALNEAWRLHGTEMEDIPIETRRRALELEARITQAANQGDVSGFRDAVSQWKRCWMPAEDVAEREYRIEERAAIMEFDGKLSREEAEALARNRMPRE